MADLEAAIIGYGLAGSVFHAPLIACTPGLAVASVVTSRTDEVRRDHPGARVLSRPEDVWERAAEHDLVVVATPNAVHGVLARAAIDAGLPVVVDKPLAVSAAEARSVVDHAERAGVLLTAFHNRRWDSDQLTLRRLIAGGELGDVLRYESRIERWRPELKTERVWRETVPPSEGGGVLLDLGTHLVDQALHLFGPVAEVYGEVETRRGGAADDDAFIALVHESGTISHLWASQLVAAPGPRLRVLGAKGAYVVDDVDGQEDALCAGFRPDDDTTWGAEPESRWGRLVRGEESSVVPSEHGDWPRFYAQLARAIRVGGPPPVDPHDAIVVLEVLEAARA
jgi:scyllo-inositol 2-dehydrogenase (NADP+)